MKINKENSNQIQNINSISINNIISNLSQIRHNRVLYQKIPPTKTYRPRVEERSTFLGNSHQGRSSYIPKRSLYENKRYTQTKPTTGEPNKFSKIIKKEVKPERQSVQTLYKSRFVKNITYSNISNFNNRSYTYSNYNSNPNMRHSITYFTNTYRSSSSNNIHYNRTPSNHKIVIHNYYTNPEKSSTFSKYKYSNINSNKNYSTQYNSHTFQNNNITITQYSQKIPPLPKKLFTSKYYTKINLKPPTKLITNSTIYERKSFSPGVCDLRRKTVNRGNPIKNVQITHVICSKQPSKFNIKEKLSTEFLEAEPMRLTQTERFNLKKDGISSFTTSVQDNIKPVVVNLKGRTTVYQHARGIGMTNDRRGKLNPKFYTSTIKKLNPITKIKQKEKVEYMTFRNELGRSSVYNYNTNRITINNSLNDNNIRNSVNYVRSYNNYNISSINNSLNNNTNNQIEIIKESKNSDYIGNITHLRTKGDAIIYIKDERKINNPSNFS